MASSVCPWRGRRLQFSQSANFSSVAYPLIIERDEGRRSLKTSYLPVEEKSLIAGKDRTCGMMVEDPCNILIQ